MYKWTAQIQDGINLEIWLVGAYLAYITYNLHILKYTELFNETPLIILVQAYALHIKCNIHTYMYTYNCNINVHMQYYEY